MVGSITVAQGGTGGTSFSNNKILIGNGSSVFLTDTNLHWDNTKTRLGIGNVNPQYTLDVGGSG